LEHPHKFNDEDHRAVDAWLKKLAKDAGLSSVALAVEEGQEDRRSHAAR
jgi:hypothetical protein